MNKLYRLISKTNKIPIFKQFLIHKVKKNLKFYAN